MTLQNEKILSVAQRRGFRLVTDILRECFGVEKRSWQYAQWPPASEWENTGYRVWFPHLLTDRHGNLKAASSEWVNSISQDGIVFTTVQPEDVPAREISRKDIVCLIFAKEGYSGNYYFYGAFLDDVDASEGRVHKLNRIATQVLLCGEPVNRIELLDRDNTPILRTRRTPLDDSFTEKERIQHAKWMDNESLRRAAEATSCKSPGISVVSTKQYKRSWYVAEQAKRSADGICQLCGNEAPFYTKSGEPYLETHHIVPLSEGGADTIQNTIALCPNCHRRMHQLRDMEDISFLKIIAEHR